MSWDSIETQRRSMERSVIDTDADRKANPRQKHTRFQNSQHFIFSPLYYHLEYFRAASSVMIVVVFDAIEMVLCVLHFPFQ